MLTQILLLIQLFALICLAIMNFSTLNKIRSVPGYKTIPETKEVLWKVRISLVIAYIIVSCIIVELVVGF